jgi:hypothetical protein
MEKKLKIYTKGFKFESGYASLVRAWDSKGFTRSPGPTKYAFRGVEFPKKKKASPNPCLISKKDGTLDMSINQITRKYMYPISCLDNILS